MSDRHENPQPGDERPKRPSRLDARSDSRPDGSPPASRSQPAKPRRPRSKPLPLFRVLLLGAGPDEAATVRAVVELTPLSPGAARAITAEAADRGRATVLVAHRERAELYAERLAERGLSVSLEPVE